jgi:hypothetical protein
MLMQYYAYLKKNLFFSVFVHTLFKLSYTERRGRVINTPVSYSEVPGSNLAPKTDYPEVFHGSPQSLQANPRTVS